MALTATHFYSRSACMYHDFIRLRSINRDDGYHNSPTQTWIEEAVEDTGL